MTVAACAGVAPMLRQVISTSWPLFTQAGGREKGAEGERQVKKRKEKKKTESKQLARASAAVKA